MQDPIEVFCRVRPLENSVLVCLKAKDETTVVLFPPEVNQHIRAYKEIHSSFKEVFNAEASQKRVFDRVVLPLIEDALKGFNGLVFTYGITSSGKTYTMAGTPMDGGLLPRTLDVIFNSIKDYQAPKFVIKPDTFNGYDIQNSLEANQEYRKELRSMSKALTKSVRRERIPERAPDASAVIEISPDVNYAIFVSYVEIYNNYVYDLLEDSSLDPRNKSSVKSKLLREDAFKNMYVASSTECEVKSVEEALELFYKGQLKRKVSHTALNTESSRSHSVFNIRVVQAPLDTAGGDILRDKKFLVISQLSLVDLAGSERSVRTNNVGNNLREAGNINNSLMTLRTCIELLRDSQIQGIAKKIPYRDSKLTHLFKKYFEGCGKVRMIVCVNPQADYYEETIHVLKFSEMTQDVLITRPVSTPPVNVGLMPGRGKLYREASKKAKEHGVAISAVLAPVYSLGADLPILTFDCFEEVNYTNLIELLAMRQNRRNILCLDLEQKQEDFRNNLIATDKENAKLKQERSVLKSDLESRKQQLILVENKLSSSDQEAANLQNRLAKCQDELEHTKFQLSNASDVIANQKQEIESIKLRMKDQIEMEKDRTRRLMEIRLAAKQAELERKIGFSEEKFRLLSEIISQDDYDIPRLPVPAASSDVKGPSSNAFLHVPGSGAPLNRSKSESDFLNIRRETVKDTAKLFENNLPQSTKKK